MSQESEATGPSVKRSRESSVIQMAIKGVFMDSSGMFSPVTRIGGFPWRVHIYPSSYAGPLSIALHCDKSTESYLWQCTAKISVRSAKPSTAPKVAVKDLLSVDHTFVSWKCVQKLKLTDFERTIAQIEVEIVPKEEGESFRMKPSLDPLSDARDAILVVGDSKIFVNKQSLASQSSYFNALFFGGFKEEKQSEIKIEGVEQEDLDNLIRLMYGFEGQAINVENVEKIVHLSQRFDFKRVSSLCVSSTSISTVLWVNREQDKHIDQKIVEDKAINFLLNTNSISTHRKLLLSEQLRLDMLKNTLLLGYDNRFSLLTLRNSPEYPLISNETIRIMFEKSCQTIGRYCIDYSL